MKIKILSPNKKIYKRESKTITLPGQEGELQILDKHAPLFTLLKKGEIILEGGGKIPIFSGIAEILNNEVIILIKEP